MAPYVIVPASVSSMVPLPGLVGEPQSWEIKKANTRSTREVSKDKGYIQPRTVSDQEHHIGK